jgi:hypothetical protein
LRIENRAVPLDEGEIQLGINMYKNTNYTIVSEGIVMQGATAFLYENSTNISAKIRQSGIVNYNYSIDSAPSGSITAGRFKIVFAAMALSVNIDDMEDARLYYETGFTVGEVSIKIGSRLSTGEYFVKLSSVVRTIAKKLTIN